MKKFKEKVYRKVLKENFSETIYKRHPRFAGVFRKGKKHISFFMEAWETGGLGAPGKKKEKDASLLLAHSFSTLPFFARLFFSLFLLFFNK